MATNFDDLVDSVTTVEPSAPPLSSSAPVNSFDSLVDQVTAPDQTALHASLYEAQTANPQEEARRKKDARTLQTQPNLVTADSKALIRQTENDPVAIAKTSPGTAKFLTNPENAKIAVDGVAGLSDMEATATQYGPSRVLTGDEFTKRVKEMRAKNPTLSWDQARQVAMHGTIIDNQSPKIGASQSPIGNLSNFFTGQLAGVKAVGEQVKQSIRRQVADLFDFETVRSDAAAKVRRAQFEASIARPLYESGLGNDLYTGAENVAQNVPGLAAAILLKNPQLALSIGTGLTQTMAYNKYRDRGGSVAEAQLGAGLEGTLEYVTELIPMNFLAQNVGKIPLWKLVAANQGQEQVQEQVATVSQDFVDFAIANPDKTFGQYLAERPEAARQTAIAVAMQAGVVTVAGAVHQMVAGQPEIRQASTDIRKAYQAEQGFQTLTALTEKAAQDTTRELDSQTFHEFVTTMTEENQTLQDVYVDAKVLGEALAAHKVDVAEIQSKMPEVASQLQEGLATGGQVRISTADYLTYIAPSPVAQAILPELRTSADGMTYNEAQGFYQEQTARDEAAIKQLKIDAEPVLPREEFEAQQSAQVLNEAAPVLDAAVAEMQPEEAARVMAEIAKDPQAVAELDAVLEKGHAQTYEEYLAAHPNKKAVLARDTNDVHNKILADLQNTGRFPRAVNAAYAVPFREFYAQNAKRMGVLPSQLYERMPMRVVAEAMFGPNTFTQPEETATLADFAPGKVQDILRKFGWAVMTAENPANAESTPEANATYMEQLRTYLDANNIQYENVKGKYDRDENSVLLFGVTARQALDIGRLFNLESVLTRDGLVYQNGDVNPTTGDVTEFTEEPENYFTKIPSLGTAFSVGIDFDTTLKAGEHQAIDLTAFEKWFGDSKVVDEQGRPLVVYHGTSADFEAFRNSRADVGMHFGTTGQAADRLDYLREGNRRPEEGMRTLPVYLSLKNPLRLPDLGAWNADTMGYALRNQFPADAAKIRALKTPKQIRDYLKTKNYDGIVYKNTGEVAGSATLRERIAVAQEAMIKVFPKGKTSFSVEDQKVPEYQARSRIQKEYQDFREANAEDSYIVFEPTQIKSAIGNIGTFDPNNPNILKQNVEGGKVGEVSVVGTHFSPHIVNNLSGNYFGRNQAGREKESLATSKDSRIRQRLNFYVDEGKGVFPEAGVGRYKYVVKLDNLYDAARNPQKFPKRNADGEVDFNLFESAVLDAGFNGYYVEEGFHRQGVAVVLGEPSTTVRVGEPVDTIGKHGPFYQSAQGWYFSQLARTIENAKTESMPAGQWKAWLTANAAKFGVKKDEIQWTGLTDWLDLQTGKITKAQIADYLNGNGVKVEEVVLGKTGALSGQERQELDDLQEKVDSDSYTNPEWQRYSELRAQLDGKSQEGDLPPKFATYVLPGGENYRELLLTLPTEPPEVIRLRNEIVALQGKPLDEQRDLTPDELAQITELRAKLAASRDFQKKPSFHSSHFDQPNILAHVRFDERTDADGNRVLFIEEIQSDWGQKGKKEGFAAESNPERVIEINQRLRALAKADQEDSPEWDALTKEKNALQKQGTPSAPFVTDTKSWTALALKRMIAYAVENNFDRIAWTTGEQQAERYDLSKQISRVEVKDYSGVTLTVYGPSGSYLTAKHFDTYDDPGIEDFVGKDLAEKIAEDRNLYPFGLPDYVKDYRGLDLKVGGEGMKGFYDKIVPQVANDVLKKLGGGKVDLIPFGDFKSKNASEDDKLLADLGIVVDGSRPPGQPGFTITEEMQAKVADGLPLFQKNLGSFDPNTLTVALLNGANLSTVLHEGGHFYLRALELMANMPEATQEIKDDYVKVLNWFGVTQQQWESMSVEQQRPYHEQWAQSQERWMLEGVSPTIGMQPVFSRFRAWMLNIYKSIEQFLIRNPLAGKLDDEIRGVFSRLIASEEAIAQAELLRGYSPLPQGGASATEYSEYLAQYKQATEDAVNDLQKRSIKDMKWVSGARSKAVRELQRQAAGIRADIKEEVTAQVMAEPINQARNFLKTGEMTDPNSGELVKVAKGYKLDTAAVKSLYPETALGNPDLSKLKGYTSPTGLDPDIVAKMFGFTSGDQLIRELIDGEDAQQKIEGLTDQRMLEEHGDLVDQRAIEAAADEAVHNEARARFMATGLRMLTKSPISSYQLSKSAKEAAERAVAGKKVRDLRPTQYTTMETKALKEALKLAPTKPLEAADAQRSALLNNRMAQASYAAQAEVKKILKYISKFKNEGTRKALDIEYLEQIDELLAAFDADPRTTLRELATRQSLSEWVQQQEAMGFEPTIDPETLGKLNSVSYKDMTMEELRGFVDSIKEVEHLGRMKKKFLTALDKRAFQERMAEAEASIVENANRVVKERGTPADVVSKIAKFGRQFAANHRKFSSFLREMDGGKDNGVMWNLLARAMNEAGTREVRMRAEANEAVSALFAKVQKSISDTILPGNLYARKTVVPGTDISMTTEERIMFAMNWGNDGNRQRLLDGGITGRRGLSISEAQAVLDTLTQEQWDFVQGIWDFISTYRPMIEEQERQLTGKTPEWVEPSPIATKFGTYAGGYFPAKYDAVLSTRSESLEAATNLRMGMKGAFNSAATRNGYTKERSAQVVGRPLLLSFNSISQHVSEVTHRIAWQPWLIDANRTFKALDSVIREHYGPEVLGELRNTVRDIAQGDVPATTPTEVFINRVRSGSTVVGMAWRLTTALMQPSGLAQSWARVGGSWVAKGVKEFVASPSDTASWVLEHSDFMKYRAQTMNREINELLNTVRTGEKASAVQASYFYLIGEMQQVVDIPTWVGAYEKALYELNYDQAAGQEERDKLEAHAIALADQAVKDSQSHGEIMDRAGVQRGSPAQQLWTNFYSYFSATYNLNVEAYRRTNFKSPSEVGVFAADMVLLNIVPVIFSTALMLATKQECDIDDTECMAKAFGQQELGYLFGQMILLREAGAAVQVALGGPQYGYSGPAGLRFFSDLYKAGVQASQGEADLPLFKAINGVLGAVLHYPAGQVNTTVEGVMAIENGEVEGWGVLPAVLFGPPK